MLQPIIRNLVVATEIETLELGEVFEMLQPHIRNLGVLEIELLELGETGKRLQPRVRNIVVVTEIEVGEILQLIKPARAKNCIVESFTATKV